MQPSTTSPSHFPSLVRLSWRVCKFFFRTSASGRLEGGTQLSDFFLAEDEAAGLDVGAGVGAGVGVGVYAKSGAAVTVDVAWSGLEVLAPQPMFLQRWIGLGYRDSFLVFHVVGCWYVSRDCGICYQLDTMFFLL